MFLDESTFVMRNRNIRRFSEEYRIQAMKHPPKQMIWDTMFKSETARLYLLTLRTTMMHAM